MTGHQKGLLAEYFTVGWNVVEGIVAVAAGVVAGSIALVGFGLDSYIEVASGLVLIWRLRKQGFIDEEDEEAAEKRAVLFVGVTFFLLAVYVIYESGKKLFPQERPEESLIGIALAFLSLIVMPLLAAYKKKIASEINSRALRADALETLACSYYLSRCFWALQLMPFLPGGGPILSRLWRWFTFSLGKDGRRLRRVEAMSRPATRPRIELR